jgi:major membrane immunogen (membrane-anchored lipoprotein)
MYPDTEEQLTTIKKRTMTQGQFHKAYKTIEESKDKIISTLKIESGSIMYINGRVPSKDNYVPTD